MCLALDEQSQEIFFALAPSVFPVLGYQQRIPGGGDRSGDIVPIYIAVFL